MRESSTTISAPYGLVRLNKIFEELLRRKLGRNTPSLLTEWRIAEALRYFEYYISYRFNPLSKDCGELFEIPVLGTPNIPQFNWNTDICG